MRSQNKRKYFSYIMNRKFGDYYLPTRYQYVILRDYYQKINEDFILPQGEPVFSSTKIRLRTLVKNLKAKEGLILLSIYQWPEKKEIRDNLVKELIKKKIELHFIFEGLIVKNVGEFQKIKDILKFNKFVNAY